MRSLQGLRRWALGMSAGQVWAILLTMLVAGPVGSTVTWWVLHQPPVKVMQTYEEDAVATSGGQLDLIATKIDNAPCLTTVARFLWRYDPTDPRPADDPQKRRQWREITGTPHSPPMVGKVATYRLVVPLPDGIEPGEWHYQGMALDSCAGPLTTGPRFSRDIPIRITTSETASR